VKKVRLDTVSQQISGRCRIWKVEKDKIKEQQKTELSGKKKSSPSFIPPHSPLFEIGAGLQNTGEGQGRERGRCFGTPFCSFSDVTFCISSKDNSPQKSLSGFPWPMGSEAELEPHYEVMFYRWARTGWKKVEMRRNIEIERYRRETESRSVYRPRDRTYLTKLRLCFGHCRESSLTLSRCYRGASQNRNFDILYDFFETNNILKLCYLCTSTADYWQI
jgi:hypothetical protein